MATFYFDHNATTPLDPFVLEAMLPYMGSQFANASATYTAGREARRAVDKARAQVADAIDADPSEVIFTASGSEANNLLIRGFADARMAEAGTPVGVACSRIEHPCVAEPVRALGRSGWAATEIGVDTAGVVETSSISALPADTCLLSVMSANNETGVLQPVAQLARSFKAVRNGMSCVHTDAVQAFGKHPLSFRELNAAGVDALTLSAHKIGGPKGAAALVRDRQLPLMPLVYGGGQEQGLRSGTENVAAIVGMGVACGRAVADLAKRIAQVQRLQEHLEGWLKSRGAVIFSAAAERLPNTTFAAFPGIDGETLVSLLDRQGIAIASGAACGSGKSGVSAVLLAMGVDPLLAKGALRISLGMMPYGANSIEEVDRLTGQLDKVLSQLQRFAAVA